jgi:hypothetical protein
MFMAHKKFVRELYNQKRYFDAISETQRLLACETDENNRKDYSFFIAVNYFCGGQYGSVIHGFTPGPLDYRSGILLSQSYLKLGLPERGLETALGIPYASLEPARRYTLLLRRSEAYLESGMYRELLDELNRAGQFVPEREKVDALRGAVERYRRLPFKSVPLAVALSVFIPGAGQMYAGKYALGVMSFIGVAAMAGGAYMFYRRGQMDLSYTFIFFSSVFYLGNIYGAFNASQSVNEKIDHDFRARVKGCCIPGYDPKDQVRDNRIFR